MNRNELTNLAKAFRAGKLPLSEFLTKINPVEEASSETSTPRTARLDDSSIDLDRKVRCGYPEVIYGEGKSVESLVAICQHLIDAGQPVLVTRLDEFKADSLQEKYPQGLHNRIAGTFRLAVPGSQAKPPRSGSVAIISAGTSDLPVAEEARETLAWMGIEATMVHDVGVAGPHRIVERLPEFENAKVAIVVAGMEAALPSVVGGYLSVPVVAVPTSVGYGANFGGVAALLGMLNSCAANVTVVNIDAGFKAAYVAGLIANR